MSSNEKRIERLYSLMLSQKKQLREQVDIYGIEDIVYNPLTGSQGEDEGFGYGYEGGEKRSNYTWGGHGDHLHLSFRDRDVAIRCIDKAIEMGLNARENPYSKDDPDGVQSGHKGDSWHFRLFPGDTPVTGAIDITGNKSTIAEFIRWVESQYAKEDGAQLVQPQWLSRGYKQYRSKLKNLPWSDSENVDVSAGVGASVIKGLKGFFDGKTDEDDEEMTVTASIEQPDDMDDETITYDQVIGQEDDKDGEGSPSAPKDEGDPVLRLMAKNIFQENELKQKRLIRNVEKIKNLLK